VKNDNVNILVSYKIGVKYVNIKIEENHHRIKDFAERMMTAEQIVKDHPGFALNMIEKKENQKTRIQEIKNKILNVVKNIFKKEEQKLNELKTVTQKITPSKIWKTELLPNSKVMPRHHKTSIVRQMFGKAHKDLTREEKRRYEVELYHIKSPKSKRMSNKENFLNQLCVSMFNKKHSQLNKKEEDKLNMLFDKETYLNKKNKPALVRTMYNKAYNELTPDELKFYKRINYHLNKKN